MHFVADQHVKGRWSTCAWQLFGISMTSIMNVCIQCYIHTEEILMVMLVVNNNGSYTIACKDQMVNKHRVHNRHAWVGDSEW